MIEFSKVYQKFDFLNSCFLTSCEVGKSALEKQEIPAVPIQFQTHVETSKNSNIVKQLNPFSVLIQNLSKTTIKV